MLTQDGEKFSANGTIDAEGRLAVTIRNRKAPYEKRFEGTLKFEKAVTDHNVGEVVRRLLAKTLRRLEHKVGIDYINLFPEYPLQRAGEAFYQYMGTLDRDQQHFYVTGKVGDKVSLSLHDYDPHPSGGGTVRRVRFVDTLPLDRVVDRNNQRALEAHVRDLVHRRIAKHLRCAPRLLTVVNFRLSLDTTEEDARRAKARRNSRAGGKDLPRVSKKWR